MGVDLGDLLQRKRIEIKDLSGRWVALMHLIPSTSS